MFWPGHGGSGHWLACLWADLAMFCPGHGLDWPRIAWQWTVMRWAGYVQSSTWAVLSMCYIYHGLSCPRSVLAMVSPRHVVGWP